MTDPVARFRTDKEAVEAAIARFAGNLNCNLFADILRDELAKVAVPPAQDDTDSAAKAAAISKGMSKILATGARTDDQLAWLIKGFELARRTDSEDIAEKLRAHRERIGVSLRVLETAPLPDWLTKAPAKAPNVESTNLPTGDELDLAVATEVMGWKLHPAGTYEVDGHMTRHYTSMQPSTNIAHAWEVVEKGCVSGPADEFTIHRSCDGTWLATFSEYEGSVKTVDVGQADSTTAQVAICHAALLAARAKQENSK